MTTDEYERLPSTKVLEPVFELDRLGNRHPIYTMVNMKTSCNGRKYAPLVILGPPNDCSMMTFRPVDS